MNDNMKMNDLEEIIVELISLETKMTKSTLDRGNPAKADTKRQVSLLNKLSKLIDVDTNVILDNLK